MTRNILLSTAILLGLQTIALGQNVVLSIGSGSATPGGTVTVPITLTSSGGAQTTGLQWTFSYSSDIMSVAVVAGASTTNAGKALSCSGNNCLAAGINSTVIADGTVATATFQIAANPSTNPIPIQLTNVVATTADGNSIPSGGATGGISLPVMIALSSLTCTSFTISAPGSTACSVALTGSASASGFVVALSSNNANLTVPSSVTVASGQTSATFRAASGTVSSSQTAIVTATLNSQIQTVTLSLAAAAQLSTLTCSPSIVAAPGTSTCTVTLNPAASGATSVTLLSNNANVTVPGSVNVGAGLSSATFTASVAAVTSNQGALLTASLNGASQSFTLSATAPAPVQLSSLACAPPSLGSNASSTCTVTLTAATSGAATVALASDNVLLTVPASVTVASGQSSATFTAASGTVSSSQSATVTATLNSQNQQATISLAAAAPLSGLSCSPPTVTAPGTSTCTVTLTAAASSAASVTLASNNANVTVPASVNIGAGLSSAAFTASVAAVASNQTALLTATFSGVSQSFTLTVQSSASRGPTSLSCSPSAIASNVSANCTVSLGSAIPSDSVVAIASSSQFLSVPSSVTVPAGQSSATFTALAGTVNSSQSAIVTATLNGQSQQATIALAAAVNCQEFRTSPGGLCMIQDVLPWITFGGGWQSHLNAGNLSNAAGGGTIQFSFTLLPAVPATGGAQNHMPAYFKDSISGQTQLGESATYALSAGAAVGIDFLSSPAGCDIHGQNCGGSPDPDSSAYGSLLVQYVADNPASLRGIAKAQLALWANVANPNSAWQTTESEMPAANQWTAPVSVSANPSANPQATQQASAALANPGPSAITVRGTLYDKNGLSVTFRDFQIPSLGSVALVFSQDPSQPFGGFGQAMFPNGQDFDGLVTFQVTSPGSGSVSAMVLQYVGNAVSSVEMNPQTLPTTSSSASGCAEFATNADGSCSVQYSLPWVVFGGGWESRLKVGNPPSATSGAVLQFGFTLLPAVSAANGLQNHLSAYFTDNRTGASQVGESATYALSAGQSVDVDFLAPPAVCNSNGQNCGGQPDPSTLAFGSVLVQYSSFDPGTLRKQANPQLAFLARPSGQAYASQITEQAAVAANTWTAPVAMNANPNANPLTYQQVSAAINNPGPTPVTVRGTLRDQNGNVVTYQDFQISPLGATGIVFAWDRSQPFGGFGSAAFPQGQDFNGWVTFNVTSPGSSGVSVLVLQYVGNTISSVNVQALP